MSEARDPFADDVLERLIASNQHYQRTHGNYIVPLAERLLACRAREQTERERAESLQADLNVVIALAQRRGLSADLIASALSAREPGKEAAE